MKYINVRQLVHNLDEAVSELPVTVTRYGKPFLLIDQIPGGMAPKKIEFVGEKSFPCEMPFCHKPAYEKREGKNICPDCIKRYYEEVAKE